jgi:excisionase family DNA binding protein
VSDDAARPLTITQAAQMLGVHQNTLRAWVDKGLVPALRLPSGHRRFTAEQIEKIKQRMQWGERRPRQASKPLGRRGKAPGDGAPGGLLLCLARPWTARAW